MNENENYEIQLDLSQWQPTAEDIDGIKAEIKANIQSQIEIGEPIQELEELLQTVQNKPFEACTKAKVQEYYSDMCFAIEWDILESLINPEEFQFICKVLGVTKVEITEIEEELKQ